MNGQTKWREALARDVHKNNPALTNRPLNEVVQRLLDRIVFIRIAEDRRIIEKYKLRSVAEEWRARGEKIHIFEWLNGLFHEVNEDFNGEIFKPHLSEEIKIASEGSAFMALPREGRKAPPLPKPCWTVDSPPFPTSCAGAV